MNRCRYNFSPGPATLPRAVLEVMQHDMLDWQGTGKSVVEISHRDPAFVAIAASLERHVRQLLSVPDTHHVLFAHGGATMQFSALPLNCATEQLPAYLITGHWSRKAYKTALALTGADLVADSKATSDQAVPDINTWNIPADAAYLYYVDNETVNGVMLQQPPETHLPLVCDMTSSIFTQPIDVSRYGAIIASAQKNMGVAGLTMVIIHDDLLQRTPSQLLPPLLNYKLLQNCETMPNTICTFAWYSANLMCEWMQQQGGVTEMLRRRKLRSRAIYDSIDENALFSCVVDKAFRSPINPVFTLSSEDAVQRFLLESHAAGLHSLKGHRVVGGCRASLYNGLPVEGAQVLADFIRDFK